MLFNIVDTTMDFKDRFHVGGLEWNAMVSSTKEVAAQKLACLLHYFVSAQVLEGTDDDVRQITVERRVAGGDMRDLNGFRRWAAEHGAALRCGSKDDMAVQLRSEGMEDVPGSDAFVNFANANFG